MVKAIAWLVFIRADSRRLPGKCYLDISGKNVFGWLSARSEEAGVDKKDLFLCTSDKESNRQIIKQAEELGHSVLIGPEEYPAERIVQNWDKLLSYRFVVRICGDSPMYPFRFVSQVVSMMDKHRPVAITNTRLRNFPSGFSIEVYETEYLKHVFSEDKDLTKEEHMSVLLRSRPYTETQRTVDISSASGFNVFGEKKYTLDTESDLVVLRGCLLYRKDKGYEDALLSIPLDDGLQCED